MKIICTITVFLLCCVAGAAQASDAKLPLDKRISMEKLLLIEEYQSDLLKCRAHTRKAAKNTCIKRKKTLLTTSLEDLQQNPRAYFISKDQLYRDEKTLQENRN